MGLMAIQEGTTPQGNEPVETCFFIPVDGDVEKAKAEDIDNNNQEMHQFLQDQSMLKGLQDIAVKSKPVRPPRPRRISMPDTKYQQLHFSVNLPPKSSSENTLRAVEKKAACKTVSDPTQFQPLPDPDPDNVHRERSCSDPEVELSPQGGDAQKNHHGHRKLSMKGFKFHRRKSKGKSGNTADVSSGDIDVGSHLDHSGDEGSDGGIVREDIDPYGGDVQGDVYDGEGHSGGFLRRMSVKVKSIMLGKEPEERIRPRIEVLDLSDDKGRMYIRQMSIQEIQGGGMGMSTADDIAAS